MKAAANALQTAIYSLLNTDTGSGGLRNVTTPLVLGIFDQAGVPEGQLFPYLTIGEFFSEPLTTWGAEGEVVRALVHVWTRKRGYKDAFTILNRVNVLLGDAALTVTGYSLARSIFQEYNSVHEPLEDVEHVMGVYRVWLQETA